MQPKEAEFLQKLLPGYYMVSSVFGCLKVHFGVFLLRLSVTHQNVLPWIVYVPFLPACSIYCQIARLLDQIKKRIALTGSIIEHQIQICSLSMLKKNIYGKGGITCIVY